MLGIRRWVQVLRLPQFRVVGLRATANAVVTTLPFPWPAVGKQLWLNVAARWYGGNVAAGTTLAEKQIGCNEGCAAYVMVEVLDDTNVVIDGYDRLQQIHQDVDEVRLPLAWAKAHPITPGTTVSLRLHFRDATIYAIGSD